MTDTEEGGAMGVVLDAKMGELSELSLFEGHGPREMKRVASLVDIVDLPAGTVLCREGQTGVELFALIEGTVTVERDGEPIATRASGDLVGELAVIDGQPRSATVTASTPVRAAVISRPSLRALCDLVPGTSMRVLRSVATLVRTQAEPDTDR